MIAGELHLYCKNCYMCVSGKRTGAHGLCLICEEDPFYDKTL